MTGRFAEILKGQRTTVASNGNMIMIPDTVVRYSPTVACNWVMGAHTIGLTNNKYDPSTSTWGIQVFSVCHCYHPIGPTVLLINQQSNGDDITTTSELPISKAITV